MKVITIGRHEDNDVFVDDPCASRHHLQIIQHDDGHYSLADFGSTNGTFINGQQISGEVDLNINDVVRIGNSTIPWRLFFEKEEQDSTQEIEKESYTPADTMDMAGNRKSEEKKGFDLSSTSLSIGLLVTMSLPLIIMMVMGAWEYVGRLVVALIFALFAVIYSKKTDRMARNNEKEKAVKAAKNAKGFNVVQIIYGVFSWIALIIALSSI